MRRDNLAKSLPRSARAVSSTVKTLSDAAECFVITHQHRERRACADPR
jgi:hypothetical protein